MNRKHQQLLISVVTFIAGLYFFLEFILPKEIQGFQSGKSHENITKGLQTISAMALGLGIVNILMFHGIKVMRTREGWFNSAVLITGLFVTLWIQGVDLINSERQLQQRQEFSTLALFATQIEKDFITKQIDPNPRINALAVALARLKEGCSNEFFANNVDAPRAAKEQMIEKFRAAQEKAAALGAAYLQIPTLQPNTETSPATLETATKDFVAATKTLAGAVQEVTAAASENSFFPKASHFLETAFFNSLGAAMFSLLAFYIANAAYRSFRIRSFEAAVMMTAALVVMFGQIPHGPLYISADLPHWRLWLIRQISTPAFRAIFFGSSIAGLAMAVRMWLSMEQSPLSGRDSDDAGT